MNFGAYVYIPIEGLDFCSTLLMGNNNSGNCNAPGPFLPCSVLYNRRNTMWRKKTLAYTPGGEMFKVDNAMASAGWLK